MTAQLIAAPHKLDLEIESDLDEIDFGAWRGRTFAELDTDPEWRLFNMARGSARTPGGETIISVSARIERAFNRIRDRSPDQMVAVISHGDVIRAALCWVLGLAPDLMLRFEISPGSVSAIEFGDGAPRLLVLNWIDVYPQGLPN
jgi:probable phosphoglycerate mutase